MQRIRRVLGLVLAPTAFLAILSLPASALEPRAQAMAAISVLVVVLWVTEAIPLAVSALLGPALAVVLGVAPAKQAFASFAHPLIFLFLGGFMLARALSAHQVDRRVALRLLSSRAIDGAPSRAMIGIALVAFTFSMWISNTATTAMMIPIALGLCGSIRRFAGVDSTGSDSLASTLQARFEEGMLITLAYATSIGGICTPIGTAPNLLAIGALRDLDEGAAIEIDFLEWMAFAIPIAVVCFVGMMWFASRRFPPPLRRVPGLGDAVRAELAALGPLRVGERRVIVIFALTVLGWILPSLLRLALGEAHPTAIAARDALDEGVVAILGASALFLIPGQRREDSSPAGTERGLIGWREAASIDWGTLFLLGGGLAMGDLVFETGLAAFIAERAVGGGAAGGAGLGVWEGFLLLAAATTLVIYLTELTSNLATASMMLPVLVPLALRTGLDPMPMTICVTFAASFAFMLPVSTPPNAIAYGTGKVRIGTMIRFGAWMNVGALALLLAAGAWFLPLFDP